MVGGLVVLLGMGLFQLGLALYVRNALISSASEGARLGARAGSSPAEGSPDPGPHPAGPVLVLARRRLGVDRDDGAGVRVVEVTVTAPLPVIGLLGPSGSMTVHGRAFEEAQ